MFRILSLLILPVLVLLIGLAGTFFWWNIEKDGLQQERSARFELLSNQAADNIQAKFREYEDVLVGVRGLFAASSFVDRAEFQAYINTLSLKERFPNIQALSFVQIVVQSDLESYVEAVRTDTLLSNSGYPNFIVNPATEFETYYVVDYLVPYVGNESAFGFNLGSNPERLNALTFARDNNTFSITEPIDLVQGSVGVIIMLPVYKNGDLVATEVQRQESVMGFVNGVFVVSDILSSLLESQYVDLAFSIYETSEGVPQSEDNLLYETKAEAFDGNSQFTTTRIIQVANKEFTVVSQSLPSLRVDEKAEGIPLLVLIAGITTSILMFLIVGSLVFGRLRAQRLVKIRTKELAESSERLALATKSSGIGIWEWDVINNVLTWDDQMYTLYGIKPEDFKGAYEAWQAGLHPDDKAAGDEAIQAALKGEKDFDITFRVLWPNGRVRYIRGKAVVERNKAGSPTEMLGVNFDVTHEMEVDQAKTEFVSLASHQLRTPLSAINWFAQMLEAGDAGELNEEQKVFIKQVLDSNKRMVDLVDSLLNVSRIDLGTFAIEPEDVDFKEVADSVIAELEPKIAEKQHTIERNYDEAVPVLQADAKLTRIVFQNLISNAVKYTGEHGTVTVAIQKDGEFVQISVADTGYGIPKAQQSRVFEKLFRADNVREMETDGTGLGLYIIKAIAEEVGGKAWFESEEGKGTTFYVTIPLSGMKKKEGNKELD